MKSTEVPPGSTALRRYATREERFARRYQSVAPYFRSHDSLCRGFLESATDPQEFAGLRLLFPFVREMSVLRFPRTKEKLATWMHLAFIAGHDLGRGHPEPLEDVLPGLELREASRRVGVIQKCSGEEGLTFEGLRRACATIANAQWPQVPQNRMEGVILEAVLKSTRTGYAAGTVAQGDPARCEFVWDIPSRIGNGITDIVSRAMVGAPLNSVGKPVVELLEHPLVRLAREYYPAKKVERDSALSFFRQQLRARRVKSEDECPASELDLADWVSAALQNGSRLKAQHPEAVEEIFAECRNSGLQGTLDTLRAVVARAEGTEPLRLVEALKYWQQNAFGWVEPQCYGDELARVVYFSDFAIWIPWVHPSPAKEKAQTKYIE